MSGQPTIPGYGLGTPSNGMPEPAGYVYRGTGRDELTPPGVMRSWGKQVAETAGEPLRPWSRDDLARKARVEADLASQAPARQRPPARPAPAPDKPVPFWPAYYPGPGVPGRCEECGYLLTAAGHKVTCGGESS
jgi:hypothetical protein